MSTVNYFDDQSSQRIARTVQDRHNTPENKGFDLDQNDARDSKSKQVRTGVTAVHPTNSSLGTYPQSGSQFVVRMEWWEYPNAVDVDPDLERTLRSKYIVARTIDRSYLAEGTDVIVFKIPGKERARWWIIPTSAALVLKWARPTTCWYPTQSSQGAELWDFDTSSEQMFDTGERITVYDFDVDHGSVMAVPKIGPYPGDLVPVRNLKPGTQEGYWVNVAEYGLTGRRGKITQEAECGKLGKAELWIKDESTQPENPEDNCDSFSSLCVIDVCNTWGAKHCLEVGREAWFHHLGRNVWDIVPRERNSWFEGDVNEVVCPDGNTQKLYQITQLEPLDYCMEPSELLTFTHARNAYNQAAPSNFRWLMKLDTTKCENVLKLVVPLHQCKALPAVDTCAASGAVFMDLNGCIGSADMLHQSAVQSCHDQTESVPQFQGTVQPTIEAFTTNCVGPIGIMNAVVRDTCVLWAAPTTYQIPVATETKRQVLTGQYVDSQGQCCFTTGTGSFLCFEVGQDLCCGDSGEPPPGDCCGGPPPQVINFQITGAINESGTMTADPEVGFCDRYTAQLSTTECDSAGAILELKCPEGGTTMNDWQAELFLGNPDCSVPLTIFGSPTYTPWAVSFQGTIVDTGGGGCPCPGQTVTISFSAGP